MKVKVGTEWVEVGTTGGIKGTGVQEIFVSEVPPTDEEGQDGDVWIPRRPADLSHAHDFEHTHELVEHTHSIDVGTRAASAALSTYPLGVSTAAAAPGNGWPFSDWTSIVTHKWSATDAVQTVRPFSGTTQGLTFTRTHSGATNAWSAFLVASGLTAELTKTAGQTLSHEVWADVTWAWFETNRFGFSTSGSTGLVVPYAGTYQIWGRAEFAAHNTGQRILRIIRVGPGTPLVQARVPVNTVNAHSTASCMGLVTLGAGDSIMLQAWQNTGTNLLLHGTRETTALGATLVGR
jgi:hypothetical protein